MRLWEKGLAVLVVVSFGMGLSGAAAVAPVDATPVFSFADDRIDESSGLVARDGLVVTVNDSGDSNRIFTIDPATGRTVGVTRWQGEARDIEALAPADEGHVWVADIGDNTASRDRITVARVPFGRGEQSVTADTYELVYPDGAHDAETLLVDPASGRLYVVVKEFIGRVYAAPERLDPDGPNRLEERGEVLGIATDGSFYPDGDRLVLRNYGQAAVYSWPALRRLEQVDLPAQEQGEGLAVSESGEVLLSSEGRGAEVLRIDLPAPQSDGASTSGAGPGEVDGEVADVEQEADRRAWIIGLGAAVVVLAVAGLTLRRRS